MNKSILSMIVLSTVLTGCGSDSGSDSNDNNQAEFSSLKVNATSYENWTYVNLSRNEAVALSAEQAATSDDWHLAFQRSKVKSNGGASGAGKVQVAVADTQDEFYNGEEAISNIFLNADAAQYEDDLKKSYDLASLTFTQDENKPAIKGEDWYIYNSQSHTLSANTNNAWLIRHADGKTYSKFYFTALTPQPDRTYSATLNFETQAADTTQFAGGEQTVTAAMAPGTSVVCIDLDSKATMDCTGDAGVWDLRLEVSRSGTGLWTNGGVFGEGKGAAFGPQTKDAVAAYTSATTISGRDISSHYSADRSEGVFDAHSWYAYNLSGQHQLRPNFRTFLIDTNKDADSSDKYTLQLINYYSLGESGTPEIRFKKVSAQ
ncbi:HmuY family protein [Bacterioplanoides sp. SCSIO 12839]|uniref:HmuY family protein n=1 Tax=Bacterioplanoides sp. SCSIO 12839 TaxID=2829569 RepID=UPI0021077F9F|nr:HmuY family protein [Bacterioplanoides sp. SCSIO 12839]UTW47876.1 HmuY family protein [Bacterioplanoides sp. SCSIO 12839]